jgi:hypothetical protein
MRYLLPLILAVSLIIPACAPKVDSSGKTYYVATNGNDANPGSLTHPWKTIQKAAATMMAGYTVIVEAGDYSSQRVLITKSGNSASPITYRAEGRVVMKGFNIVASYIIINGFEIANTDYGRWDYAKSAGIFVKGANNILENNYIHDSSLEGIELYGNLGDNAATHDNIVRNNRLYRNEMVGINVNGRNNLIEGNDVSHTVQCHPNLTRIEDVAPDNNGIKCPYSNTASGMATVDADGMRFFGPDHIFRKNNIHDIILGDTIDGGTVNLNPHIDCFQTWAGTYSELAQNIIFEQNYCENLNVGMYAFMLANGANHIYIRNNIFKVAGGVNTGSGADYLYIYNNTWISNLALGSQGYPYFIGLQNVPHAVVQNNIFYDQPYLTVWVVGDTKNIEVDHNLAYNSDGTNPHCVDWGDYDTCQPISDLEFWGINPKFIEPASGNYHLQSTSPAIDAGFNLGSLVPNDFEDISRPQGAGYDIGAYEYPEP